MSEAKSGPARNRKSAALAADRAWDRAYADLADLATDWIWESDAEHRVCYVSRRAGVIMDTDLGNFLGKRRSEFAAEAIEPGGLERHLEDLAAHRPFRDFAYSTQTSSGIRYIKISGNPLFDEDGRFLGYRGIGTNITPRVLAEQQAEITHRQLIDAIETLSVAFSHFDADDRLILCNTAYKKFFPEAEHLMVPGTPFVDIARAVAESGVIAMAVGRVGEWLDELRERRREIRKDHEWQLSDGRWLLTNDYKSARGETICIHADITELKEREEALRQSERRFATAFQSSPCITVISEIEDGRIIDVNDKWVETLGWSRAEAIGRTAAEIGLWVDPRDRVRLIQRLKSEGSVHGFEARNKTRSGEIRDFEISAEVVPLEGKNRLLIVSYDVTERKQTEEKLRAGELRLSGILRITMEAIIAVDGSQRITLFNDGAAHIFGYRAEEILGEKLDILIPEGVRESHAKKVETFGKTAENSRAMNQRGEIKGLRKDGTEFPAEASISKLMLGDERIFTVLLHDITDRKIAEQALLAAKEEAEIANRAKSEFLANMSHELRTPLNAILGFSQVISDSVLGPVGNEKYIEYATDIRTSGEHLLDVIGDILDLARIEAGHAVVEEEEVDIAEIVDFSMRLIRDRALAAGIELTVKLVSPLPRLRLDRRKLEKVLINLLSNAVKFTENGGEIVVEGGVGRDGGFVLSVRDTGIGMRRDDITRALEPFTQIEQTMTRRHEGAGLGLPLVKSLCELLGATFEIDSMPGKGTVVTLRFPADRITGRMPEPEHRGKHAV